MNVDVMKIQKGQYRVIQTGQIIQYYTSAEMDMPAASGWYITSQTGEIHWHRFPSLERAARWIGNGHA